MQLIFHNLVFATPTFRTASHLVKQLADMPADGVTAEIELSRERLVDDHHLGRTRPVGRPRSSADRAFHRS